MSFPQTLDNFTNPTPSTPTNSPVTPLSGQLSQLNNAVEAIEGVIGVTGSTVPTSIEYRLADVGAVAATALQANASDVGSFISAATDKAAPTDADVVALSDSGASSLLKKLSWSNIKQAIASFLRGGGLINGATVTNPKIIANSVDSIPDSLADQTVLITTAASQASKIGSQTRPVGAASTNSDPAAATDATRGIPWAADNAYPNNGIAHVSVLIGGYDHVCNQEAGTLIGGGHNFMPYNANGHSTLVGGSSNQAAACYSAIVGGKNNTLYGGAGTYYSGILAGHNNLVSAAYSAIIGGSGCIINSGDECSGVVAGSACAISAANSATVGGASNVIGANAGWSAALAGSGCTVDATYSASLGGLNNNLSSGHRYSLIAGREAKSEVSGSLTFGVKRLVNQGDCQISTSAVGTRTTSASAASLTGPDGQWSLGAVGCAVGVQAQVIGVDEASGSMAFFTWSGSVKWDGSTNALVVDGGGSSASSRAMTQVSDAIGCAAVAVVAADTGILRIRVTGKAATNIKWCGRIDACAVRV